MSLCDITHSVPVEKEIMNHFTKALLIPVAILFTHPFPGRAAAPTQNSSTVVLTSFGSAGQGADDTGVLQAALNTTAGRSQTLEIPAGNYNIRPLYFPANSSVIIDPGVLIQSVSGYRETDQLLNISGVQNVSIQGTVGQSGFRMLKNQYTDGGEYRHCMTIVNASNVTVSGIFCNDSGGDGAYIAGSSSNITLTNDTFDNNSRNGLAIISVNGLLVDGCTFSNTAGNPNGGSAPNGPWDGIDIEPNQSSDVLQNIVLKNSSVTGNSGNGLVFAIESLNANSSSVSINATGIKSQGNHQSGFFAANGQNGPSLSVPGFVTISNSSSTGDGQYGAIASYWDAGGTSLTFQNLTVVNANGSKNNVDNAAIAIKRGGGATHPMGNVHFFGTSVIDTAGNLGVYFTVYDWSHIGITQLQFLQNARLSGASRNTGFLNGMPTLTLDVN